jgi:hypothetical protein
MVLLLVEKKPQLFYDVLDFLAQIYYKFISFFGFYNLMEGFNWNHIKPNALAGILWLFVKKIFSAHINKII